MSEITKGKAVTIHFTGKLSNGSIFDTSRDAEPIRVIVGEKQHRFPQAVVQALEGLKLNDTKTVKVPFSEGFGPRKEELVLEIPKDNLDDKFQPVEGQYYHINQEGSTILVKVVKVKENGVVLDANHPLAGQNLNYELEVISIANSD